MVRASEKDLSDTIEICALTCGSGVRSFICTLQFIRILYQY